MNSLISASGAIKKEINQCMKIQLWMIPFKIEWSKKTSTKSDIWTGTWMKLENESCEYIGEDSLRKKGMSIAKDMR